MEVSVTYRVRALGHKLAIKFCRLPGISGSDVMGREWDQHKTLSSAWVLDLKIRSYHRFGLY